jgi:hypothetical protein
MPEENWNFTLKDREDLVEKLKEEYDIISDIQFNEFNISDKLQQLAYIYLRYYDKLLLEKFLFKKYQEMYNKFISKKYNELRFNDARSLSRGEVEKYYMNEMDDEKVKKVKYYLDRQETVVEFFNMCVTSIESLRWNIKSFIDLYKTERIKESQV